MLNELYLRIAPDKFHFLKFILEAYDNLAILSSFDQKQGVVLIRHPVEMSGDLMELLASLALKLSVSK